MMRIDAQRRPRLAIVPLGTANDFAGNLSIPDDIAAAAALIDEQRLLPVDIIRVRGDRFEKHFANVAAGGNCVRVSEVLTDEIKSRWGALSYVRGAIEVLPDMRSFRIDVDCDDERIGPLDSWAVLVANGRTNGGHIEVAPEASPIDGLMDVIIIKDGTIADMVQITAGNLTGEFLNCEQVIFRQVNSLSLHSQPGMRFTVDGEVIDEEPVRFEVVPAAISMHVSSENYWIEHASTVSTQSMA
ncbi:MAG: YegS/Rv2252/BmrU family lipid kinase [Pirellulaceae bacterium]